MTQTSNDLCLPFNKLEPRALQVNSQQGHQDASWNKNFTQALFQFLVKIHKAVKQVEKVPKAYCFYFQENLYMATEFAFRQSCRTNPK